jgi:Type II secretion system (T2SS), protein M
VTLSDRDRRILLILIPIVVLVAYYFLLLAPKRDDLKTARDEQHSAEAARDQAVQQAAQLEHARQTFAADYAAVVRLGKAIPDTVDSPSLLVQLDRASHGTHIDFDSVTFGARAAGAVPAAPVAATQAPAQPNGNAAAGGAPAATGLGRATESAGNTVNQANQTSTAAGGTDTTSTTSTTSTTATAGPSTTAPALDTVALTFNFSGSYFDLADFFHRLKRFVYVANNQIFVRGRLLTIDTLTFAPGGAAGSTTASTGRLTATVGATVYLSPKTEGVTGGATPSGPAGSSTTTTPTPAGSQTSSVPLATAGVR